MRRTLFYLPHECFSLVSLDLGPLTFHAGWLLIGWAVFCIGLLIYLIRAQGWNRDTQSYLPVMIVISLALGFVMPLFEIKDPAGIPVGLPARGYGVMVMLGALLGVGMGIYRARRMGLHHDLILSLAFWMFLCGMTGARLFYVIQKWNELAVVESGQLNWGKTLAAAVSFQSGGLVVYGALIGGLVAAVVFLKRNKLPILAVGDLIAPSMLMGLFLGRIGCLMNGCCYGGICEADNPFYWSAIAFPRDAEPYLHRNLPPEKRENSPPYERQRVTGLLHGVRVAGTPSGQPVVAETRPELFQDSAANARFDPRPGDLIRSFNDVPTATVNDIPLLFSGLRPTYTTADGQVRSWSIEQLPDSSLPVHPTQIYSSVNAGLLALFLWFLYPSRQRDGHVFGAMLVIYSIARVLEEAIRDDELGQFGTSFTISQWVSGVVALCGIALLIYIFRQPKETHLTEAF